MTKATTKWGGNKVTIEIDNNHEDFESLCEQIRRTLVGVGYSPKTVEEYLG